MLSKAIGGSPIDYLGTEMLAARFFSPFHLLGKNKSVYPSVLSLSKLERGVTLRFYIFLYFYLGS